MNGYWKHKTRIGEAIIIQRGAHWHVAISGEGLGAYRSPVMALDDLVGGHCFSHSSGVDTATLGLPDELSEWEFIRSR